MIVPTSYIALIGYSPASWPLAADWLFSCLMATSRHHALIPAVCRAISSGVPGWSGFTFGFVGIPSPQVQQYPNPLRGDSRIPAPTSATSQQTHDSVTSGLGIPFILRR
jgi:hypothetical protein